MLTYQSNKMLMFVSHKKRLHTNQLPLDWPKKSLLLISVSLTLSPQESQADFLKKKKKTLNAQKKCD